MKSLENTTVSLVSHVSNTKTHPGTVGEILKCIKNGKWRKRLEKLRAAQAAGDEQAVEREKRWLPAVMWSGEFSRRANDALVRHSGLVCADIDDIGERVAEVRALLAKDPSVAAVFVSPRGHGLKVLFKCPPWWDDGGDAAVPHAGGMASSLLSTLEESSKHLVWSWLRERDPQDAHAAAVRAVSDYLLGTHGLTCDPGCKDVARLCIINDDPDAYINLNAEPLPFEMLSLRPFAPSRSVNGMNCALVPVEPCSADVERVRDLLNHIPKRPKYPGWIRIAAAVWSKLGKEKGCDVLREWSPEEKPGEYEELWDHRLTRIAIGTLYHIARQHGWKAPERVANIAVMPTELDDAGFILHCASRDQRGDAELFNLLGRHAFIFDHTAKRWRTYDDGVWKLDEISATRRLAKEMIANLYLNLAARLDSELSADVKSGKVSSNDIKNDPRAKQHFLLLCKAGLLNKRKQIDDVLNLSGDFLAAKADDFDARGDLLNLRNGTLNLETLCLHDHSGGDMLTKQAGVGFHPDADCPRWRKFMATIFSGDAERVAFVQRALGYSLVTDVSGDSVFFCYGSGRNGKSTMFEVLRKIWGDYLVQLPIEALLSQNRGARDLTGSAEVTRLHGARIAWTSEIPEDRRLNEALVKDLTGGDTITARRLYQNPFTFSPTHKLWMTGNHQPEIRGIDEGIWRRIHLIPFDHQFPRDGEPSYRDRASVLAELETEGPGILNWLLEGLQKYREQGLNPPAVVRRATEHYRKESDVLADFIEERCVQGPQLTVTSADLWNAYVTFCSGGRPAYSTKRALAAAMTQRGFQLHHTAKHRMIKGLALRRDDYRPDDDAYDA